MILQSSGARERIAKADVLLKLSNGSSCYAPAIVALTTCQISVPLAALSFDTLWILSPTGSSGTRLRCPCLPRMVATGIFVLGLHAPGGAAGGDQLWSRESPLGCDARDRICGGLHERPLKEKGKMLSAAKGDSRIRSPRVVSGSVSGGLDFGLLVFAFHFARSIRQRGRKAYMPR